MTTFTYPSSATLTTATRTLLPDINAADPIFRFFPLVNRDTTHIVWEQWANIQGTQFARGLNGAPDRVSPPGLSQRVERAGVFGEYMSIDETMLTEMRQIGTWATPVDISDLVTDRNTELLSRELTRIKSILWTLVVTGTYSLSRESTGALLNLWQYTTQTYSAGVAWATSATATPLADFDSVAENKGEGISASFGDGAIAFMNRKTFGRFWRNTNSSDLRGALPIVMTESRDEINNVMTNRGLPAIEVYNKGYLDSTGTWQYYIPTGKVVVIGRRDDSDQIGEYQMVRNANNPAMGPGSYTKIVDNGEDGVPRSIEVHRGHNGGPAIFHPESIVVMSV